MSKAVNRDNKQTRVLVVEDGGLPITSGLKIGDSGRNQGSFLFDDNECIVQKPYQCDRMGAVYKIQCEACNEVIDGDKTVSKKEAESIKPTYVGCTRTSLHNRMMSHLKSQRSKQLSNPLHRHDLSHHEGIVQKNVLDLLGLKERLSVYIQRKH